jgi:plastocyanin
MTLKNYLAYSFLVVSFLSSASLFAESFEVSQKDKKFSVKSIEIKAGDSIKFINEDEFFHNVFSLSDTKFFDLGSFPKGEFREVKFESPGVVEVECAIHPDMFMKVHVK